MALTRFICLKQGHKYGIDYVNILHNRIRAYLPSLEEFICYTDTPDLKFDAGIEVRLLPSIPETHGWWWKCWILGQRHPGRNLYMDLDMLIVGNCDAYAPLNDGGLTGLWNTHHLNSSILAWQNGLPQVWQRFEHKRSWYVSRGGVVGDQEVINDTHQLTGMPLDYWPTEYTAWLDVKTPRLARNWTQGQKTIVCKGPRNPHQNTTHPLVQAYWRRL